jgi:hypothetical protein
MNRRNTRLSATLIALAAAGLATHASAAEDIYHGIGVGHPDLSSHPAGLEDGYGVRAMAPGVGSDLDRYQGFAQGNPDLFNLRLDGPTRSGEAPRIYSGAEGNPDLTF